MTKVTSNNISLEDVEVYPSRGRFEDGTEFFLSDSRQYLITLPGEDRIGIRPHAEEFEDHEALREALELLTGEQYQEDEVADRMAEDGFLVGGIARRDEVAETLRDEI